MIYLDLFLGFLKVGCFAFGGAYGAIPLIRDVALSYGWLSDETLTYMIAVSESTPGPIMVNLATYVGSSQAGMLGAIVATLAVSKDHINTSCKHNTDNAGLQTTQNGLHIFVFQRCFQQGSYQQDNDE